MIFGSGPFGSAGFAAVSLQSVMADDTIFLSGKGSYATGKSARDGRLAAWDDDAASEDDSYFLLQNQNLALIHMVMGLAANGALQ